MTKPPPSHNDPVSIGIDFHKRYSVFCVLDAKGGILERGRIEHTTPELFIELDGLDFITLAKFVTLYIAYL